MADDAALPRTFQRQSQMLSRAPTRISSVTTPAPRDVWKELVEQDPDALPYQSPEWSDSACATGRYVDASRLYEMADGQRFILPLLGRARTPRALSIVASMPPTWGIGGVVGSSPLSAPVLHEIASDLRRAGFLGVHLRPNPLHADVWRSASVGLAIPRRAHVLDLSGGFEAVWEKQFTRRAKKAIHKAEKRVTVEFDTTGRFVPQFYALLQKSVVRWAAAQHEPRALALWRSQLRDPYLRFEAAADHMGEACRVGLASIDGRPVAAILVLCGHNTNYSRGVMDAELIGNSGANDLLQKLAIEHAAQCGHRYYHMGESGWSSSLSEFKEKFGAVPYEYAEYHIERLPLTQVNQAAKTVVKRLIGFKDGN